MGFEVVNMSDRTIFVINEGNDRLAPYWQAAPPGCMSVCMGPGVYKVKEQDGRFLFVVVCNSAGFRVIPYAYPPYLVVIQSCNCHYILSTPVYEWDNWFLRFFDRFVPIMASSHIGFKIKNGGNDNILITEGKNGQAARHEIVEPGSSSGCIRAGKFRIANSNGAFYFIAGNSEWYSTHPELPPFLEVQHCDCRDINSPSMSRGCEVDFLRLLDFLVTQLPFRPRQEDDRGFEIMNKSNTEVVISSRWKAPITHFEKAEPEGTSGWIAEGEYGIMSPDFMVNSVFFCNSAGVRVIPTTCRNRFEVQSINIRPREDGICRRKSEWDVLLLMFLDFFFVGLVSTPKGTDNMPMAHFEVVNASHSNITIESKVAEENHLLETVVSGHTSSCLKEGAYDVRNSGGATLFMLICKSWGFMTHPEPPPSVLVTYSCCSTKCRPPIQDWELSLIEFLSYLP